MTATETEGYQPGDLLYDRPGVYRRMLVSDAPDLCSNDCLCRWATPDGGDLWGLEPENGAMRWTPEVAAEPPPEAVVCPCGCGAQYPLTSADDMEEYRNPFRGDAEVPF